MNIKTFSGFTGAMLLCVLLVGCGGGQQPEVQIGTPALEPATAPVVLAAPSDLTVLRTTSAEPVTFIDGADTYPGLPLQRFQNGYFTPSTHPEEPWEFSDYACAGYRFNVSGETVEPVLKMSWETFGYPAVWTGEIRVSPHAYIGLANWERNRWDWVDRGGYGMVELGDLAPYTAEDGSVLVFFMISGYNDMILLNSLQLGPQYPPAAQWTVSQPEISARVSSAVLEISDDDFPVVTFGIDSPYETTTTGAGLAKFNDGNWQYEMVETGGPYALVTSLDFSVNGEPHLVFRKQGNEYFVAARNGSEWTFTPSVNGYFAGSPNALQVSLFGEITLALTDSRNLYLGFYTGSDWFIEHITDDIDEFAGFKYDGAGIPYAGFIRDNRPYLAQCAGPGWDIAQAVDWEAGEAQLAVDPTGDVHLAFTDSAYSIEGQVRYAGRTGTTWTTGVVEQESADGIHQPAIALLSNGNPVVAYKNRAVAEIVVAFLTESGWQHETVSLKPATGQLDVAIDSQDRIWVLRRQSGTLYLHGREPVE